jgi:hypothetical protein
MKKRLLLGALGAAVLLSGFMAFETVSRIRAKQKVHVGTLQTLPFFTLAGTPFDSAAFTGYKGRVIVQFFMPDCEHCQYMAGELYRHANDLANTRIVMVSVADSESIVAFDKQYHLDKLPNVVLLRDKYLRFPALFGTGIVPSFFVYSAGKLTRKITGETRIQNLLAD